MTILTILGAGRYEETNYQWEAWEHRTAYFSAAVASWFPDASVKVVATNKAWETHGAELSKLVPRAQRIAIPDGADESELWAIFNVLVDAIHEKEAVVFDITHGFRSQPVLALLVAAFLRVAKGITLEAVIYGAYEKDRENSPVFDLTPFVAMLDWATATERFLETGDARKLATLMKARHISPLNPVSARLGELSEALVLNRTELVAKTATALSQKIEEAKKENWDASYTPLKLLLKRIEIGFALLGDPEPLKAQWNQIEWLAKHHHYSAAAALAREWLVSVRVWKFGGSVLPVVKAERDEAEAFLNGQRDDALVPEGWKEAILLWRNLVDLRNDLSHCGMNLSPKKPKTITDQVEALPRQLREAVKPLGLEVGG